MSEDNKLKLLIEELKMIQDIIKRMADNSFKLKQWCVTVVVITMTFQVNINNCFIPLIPLFTFGILDAYYLTLERNFREIYNKKVENFHKETLNDIFTFNINRHFNITDLCVAIRSKSIWLFYGCILIIVLISIK